MKHQSDSYLTNIRHVECHRLKDNYYYYYYYYYYMYNNMYYYYPYPYSLFLKGT